VDHHVSLHADYFDKLYAGTGDPWALADRWYEQRKYALTVAALPRRRFRRGFEPGCSVGILTSLLAERCDELLATDVVDSAIASTAARVAGHAGARVAKMQMPQEWPDGTFDLIVFSELGYYLTTEDLGRFVDRVAETLDPDGVLVAAHWRHPVADYPTAGDDVHAVLHADRRLAILASHVEPDFLLEVYVRPPVVSVAAAEGIVDPGGAT
jgi:SAM-dependent methyltransferase